MSIALSDGDFWSNEVRRLYEASVREDFCARLVEIVASIIPASHVNLKVLAGWVATTANGGFEAWPGPVLLRSFTHPHRPEVETLASQFVKHLSSHPLYQHYRENGPYPVKISDTVDLQQFMKTEIYRHFFQPLGVKHQMVLFLQSGVDLRVALTVNRGDADFSENDLAVLGRLAPHLNQAYRNAAAYDENRNALNEIACGLDQLARALVLTFGNGEIYWESAAAREWLTTFFPADYSANPKRLPKDLREWFFRVQRCVNADKGGRLLGESRIAAGGGVQLLLKCARVGEKKYLITLKREHSRLDPEAIRLVGLTPREGDVLHWISEAKTDEEIARLLELSPRTVQKHVEHLLPKVGVENRHQAQQVGFELRRQFD
jgi:DNA-binding CsgD family transcriptional regulator